jgi:hypothetical protein
VVVGLTVAQWYCETVGASGGRSNCGTVVRGDGGGEWG